MVKRAGLFATAFAGGWVLGWLSVVAFAAWCAYRELDQ